MKHGWEIKKLGEVCEIQGGSTPKRTESLFWENGTYPWFTVEDIREQGRIITDTKQKVTKIAWDRLRVFPEDTILLCCTASLGEYALAKIPLTSNQQFNGLVIKDKKYLSPMFLMYYCATLKNKLYSLSGKATIDFVSTEKVRQILIPIPPLPEQEKIVAELDCLSGIIEKKKQQLKELDILAQSIFYEMFGNPVENDRGWETVLFKDVCIKLFAGGDVPKDNYSNTQTLEYNVPIYSNGVGEKALYGYTDIEKVTTDSLTIAGRGTIGYCEYRKAPFYPIVRLIVATPNTNLISPIFLKFVIDLLCLEGAGGAIPQLTIPMIKDKKIIIPVISLQQEFASKIDVIEKQKELIKQSIAETETLFNSRMDFYFNLL